MPQEGSRLEKKISIQEALLVWTQLETDTARLDVECLLCHSLDCDSTYLRTWPERILTSEEYDYFQALLARRVKGEPIAHICGTRSFWTLDLLVTPDTLIPRPDTEVLVETVLANHQELSLNCLDLGTGTGAIALALASEKSGWQIDAIDFQKEAVALAKSNGQRLGFKDVNIYQSDWFSNVDSQKRFDVIVSNPPYIDALDKHLEQGDVKFEPKSALVSADSGYADIENIIKNSKNYLKEHAWLYFEHGFEQAKQIQRLFAQHGFSEATTVKDYNDNDRVTYACYKRLD
mgnify:CR=1 FL=1